MTSKRAFTLIEILVVLAIVATLAALLLPVFGRVRENGKTATCQSNLHQLYLALSQYVADSDSHFPNRRQWKESLLPYTKNEGVFFCPNVSRPLPITSPVADEGSDYSYTGGLFTSLVFTPSSIGLPIPKLTGVNEAGVVDASKIYVFRDFPMETGGLEVALPRGAACGWTALDGTPDLTGRYTDRHNGGFNIVFYDGHVKCLTPEQGAEATCEAGQYAQPPFRAGGPYLPR